MAKPLLALTGASGFLGRHLVKELARDYNIRAMGRSEVPGVSCRIGSLKNRDFLLRSLKNCKVVVHAAAVTNTMDPDLEEINVAFTERLVSAAKKSGVVKFVYISTENVTYHRKDPYTQSKADAERLVLAGYEDALILRPSLIFGKEDKRYLALLVKAIVHFPLVPVFPASDCKLQPIHVEDVSKLVHQALKLDKKGIFSLVGSVPLSFAEVGRIIAKHMGKSRFFLPVPSFLIKTISGLLSLGPKPAKRLHLMLDNAFVLRNANIKNLEKEFHYKIPSLEQRLKDIAL